ncbi:MAG TPA: HAMP domain-containing sensor histidine kinase [Candidatus Limnocylindrales bacterium]|nr:HAMP domain-containing sensor histidine kinase [Candidatus Limnocylindrales bacterium]
MFAQARRRLAGRYLLLFTVVLVVFSLSFLVVLATVLQPAFDIAPEVSNEEAARLAYGRTIERIALALLLADGVVLAVIGVAGYYLADRTLRPIREAHDRQRRFVADASHEMRGPITAIRSTAEVALAPTSDATTRERALETILDASGRLGRLTDDLLVLARTEQGSLAPADEAIDLSVVVAEEVERSRTTAGDRRPRVELALTEDLVTSGDGSEIARIVGNLLDNAIRHGREPIQVRTFAVDGKVVVEVADQGPGIALADAGHIFEPFYRVRADASAPAGSGLGLAIASELARRYGGRLTLESRPGPGARFRLELPRARKGGRGVA